MSADPRQPEGPEGRRQIGPDAEAGAAAPTEARHPAAAGLHAAPGATALSRLLEAQLASAAALRAVLGPLEHASALAAARLEAGGRLIYAGAGSSGLMALADCLELAGTYGIAPERTPMLFAGGAEALTRMTGAVEDDPALAAADLARVAPGAGDAMICVSASGRTPYTLALAEAARRAGTAVIGLANVAGSPLLGAADVAVLLDSGAEVVAGSTRMAAGTAQKIALNMLSTRIGLLLGHVHDGFMVNLVADNAKLRSRAAAMVAAIAGTGTWAAEAALAQADGAVKPAVLIAAGATAPRAKDLLRTHAGRLAPALADLARDRTITEAGRAH